MAYRGDSTDPLEIIIRRQRTVRRAVLGMLLWSVVTGAWSLIAFNTIWTSPAPAAAPKMSALRLQQLLQRTPVSNGVPLDHRCDPGQNGWDYVCSYRTAVAANSPRLKIGVRVDAARIVQASAPYPMTSPLPTPTRARSGR